MQKYWDEMRRGGGAMMFRNMRDIDLTREHLQTALKDLSDSPLQNARAKWRHWIEAMDTVTNALDNSLRLAAYASARRQGRTVQQAALIAREATIDFQVKGKWSNWIGLLFPFGNVAIQTGARWSKAVYRSRMMRRLNMGLLLAGFSVAAFNYLVAGNDKDGIPFFDKIPEWDRRENFIILNPFDTDAKGRPQPIKLPMMFNYALPMTLGYAFAGEMFGKLGARKLMSMAWTSLLDAFTPFAGEHNLAAAATPELARPLVHIYTNEDWAMGGEFTKTRCSSIIPTPIFAARRGTGQRLEARSPRASTPRPGGFTGQIWRPRPLPGGLSGNDRPVRRHANPAWAECVG